MPENLPEEMKERGTHLHHKEEPVMPEMFGKEKGERFKLGPVRQAVKGMLGVRRVEEIDEAISELESEPLKSALQHTKETHVEEYQSPEFRQEILNRNKTLRDLITEGSLTEKEREIAEKLIGYNVRQLKKSEKIPTGEAGELKRIREVQEEALEVQKKATGEVELPLDKEGQREVITKYLEAIESSDLPLAPMPGFFLYGKNPELAKQVMNWIEGDRLHEDLKKEALARLRLQHCAVAAAAIPGKIEEAQEYLFKLFEPAESQKFALEGEDFKFLFSEEGERVHGLRIRDAWKELQKAATKGYKVRGKDVRYLQKNMLVSTREALMGAIQEEVEKKIPSQAGISPEDIAKKAKKSVVLAEKIAIATKETSVWNVDFQGNDPLAEAIYLRKYRTERAVRIRDRGPDNTISRIEGIGSSFFRFTKDARTRYLTAPELDDRRLDELADSPDHERRIGKILWLNRAPSVEGKPVIKDLRLISPEKIDFSQLPGGTYAMYLGGILPRVFKAKELLLKTTWTPDKDFSSDNIESWVAPFDTVDPFEVTRLKTEFLLGAFYAVFSRPKAATDLHWDGIALKGVEDNLLRTFTTEGYEVSFINQPQLSWIKKNLKKGWRINIEHEAAMVGVRTKITKRVI